MADVLVMFHALVTLTCLIVGAVAYSNHNTYNHHVSSGSHITWGAWTTWSSCDAVHHDHETRTRQCWDNQRHCGTSNDQCDNSAHEENRVCHVNSQSHHVSEHQTSTYSWSSWAGWSACGTLLTTLSNVLLGAVHAQVRQRYCIDGSQQAPCSHSNCGQSSYTQNRACVTSSLTLRGAVPYAWSQWSDWTHCYRKRSAAPVSAAQSRFRYCVDNYRQVPPSNCGSSTDDTQTRNCTTGARVDGGWGTWGQFSRCSKSCGLGFITRFRACDSPFPADGGQPCVGDSSESAPCQLQSCQTVVTTSPPWLDWMPWSPCSATCGGGFAIRGRVCSTSTATCAGEAHETSTCGTVTCPLPQWTTWSNWAPCSATCDGGHAVRVRHCGTYQNTCSGSASEIRKCGTGSCISAQWTTWSEWTPCSATCGGGSSVRVRHCGVNQTSCTGAAADIKQCGSGDCTAHVAVDGGWGSWDDWSTCSITCGLGVKKRHRSCDTPLPQNGGHSCPGTFSMSKTCELESCPTENIGS